MHSTPRIPRSQSKKKGKLKRNSTLPYSRSIPPPGTSSHAQASQDWTWQEKIDYFRSLPPVLCPASPPPVFSPLETVEEARYQSRQRIERMARRLEKLPFYQARHVIHMVSADLKGPFGSGSKYWGAYTPETNAIPEEDLIAIGTPVQAPPRNIFPRPAAPHIETKDHLRSNAATAPSPSLAVPTEPSTTATEPSTPVTPPSATIAPIELLPSKASAGRPMAPIDYDNPSPAGSPTPAPSLPPSRMGSQRPSLTPAPGSQRAFLSNLTQASRASSTCSRRTRSRPSGGLKILPSSSQPALDQMMSQDRPESRAQSPWVRPNQRNVNGTAPIMNRSGPVPLTRPTPAPFSRREPVESYNSEFSVERHIEEISPFMGTDYED
ncbi:hypothetical protein RSOLAG1IB_11059 [Rhizoctonia solani AG-1 IB]|uniref:Uncharacterized protein n=1 Tax=Thanatephorus cucumeris (strain AG1-IB / isolate 7/3/14) TaxID=1108050 RepID=A0A0B7G297_THACB|nr:hypothetical protein RSOLAG1IB_11059 [Rhizoctonia solani AG-1 IB]